MRNVLAALLALTGAAAAPPPTRSAGPPPIAVDAINPHYLRFRGRVTPLVSSGEHYGAVLNLSFDMIAYLDTLRDAGFNITRIFNGAYLETLDSALFAEGDQNTLAPRPGKYLAPWQVVAGKYDLSRWNEDYFSRLRMFVTEAGKRNIAVEVTLFSVQYGNGRNGWGSWNLNPLNSGTVTWDKFNTMADPALVAAQDALVRKTVTELNPFDNVYYEVCNEPYFSGATARQTREWSDHLIATITGAEAKLPLKHLIAENVANRFAIIEKANPAVSIFNFHYASPPVTLALNWALKKPIAFDETSDGCASPDRRWEAWAFLMAGGAVYNNLDPSFSTDDATGKATHPNCAGVRYELRNLITFAGGLDLQHMQPNREGVRQWPLYSGEVWMLEETGRVYAVYVKGGRDARITTLLLDLPEGRYQTMWLNPRTGEVDQQPAAEHAGGPMQIQTPAYTEDVALKIVRVGDAAKPKATAKPQPATRPSAPRPRARRAPPS